MICNIFNPICWEREDKEKRQEWTVHETSCNEYRKWSIAKKSDKQCMEAKLNALSNQDHQDLVLPAIQISPGSTMRARDNIRHVFLLIE